MAELLKQLQEKAGLGADKIKSVLAVVSEFLGDRFPGPIASQVNRFLGNEEGAVADSRGDDQGGGLLDKAKDALGGLMGMTSVQGTRYKVQSTRYKVQGTKYKVQSRRYKDGAPAFSRRASETA